MMRDVISVRNDAFLTGRTGRGRQERQLTPILSGLKIVAFLEGGSFSIPKKMKNIIA